MKGLDFNHLRERMVERQLLPRGISEKRVLDAFRKIPRHEFVQKAEIENAYSDFPLPIGEGQTISQPYMVALMTEVLNLRDVDRVLEIGTGSGYQAAILSELAKEVYSVEHFPDLASGAERVLKRLGCVNVKIKVADGTLGWKEYAPYEAIIVTAGAPKVPKSLLSQLKEGGRLVIPAGGYYSQVLTVVEKEKQKTKATDVCNCVFVPLVGEEGWKK